MTLMSESGSPAQALARYETFRALIGEQVGASPAKATRELASSIASAPVEPPAAAIAARTAPVRVEAPTIPSHTEAPRKRGRRLVAGTFVLAMCAAAAYAVSTAARGSTPGDDSIAVATFAAETGADSAIATAISDAVAADLSKTTGVRVMRAPGGTHAGLQVSGSITRSNDVYVGSTQLRDATGRILASNKLNSPVRDGIEAAASQVSELAEFTWNANRHLSPDALRIENARAHLRRANEDFGRGSDSASDMEIRSAHAQLEAVPPRARGFSWDSTSAATVAQEGWRWFANDHARASANFARAAALMRKHHTETSVTQAARYRSYQWIFDESSSSEALLDSARADLVAWQRDYPASASLWQEYGRVRLAQGDFVGAYDADVKARTLDPAKLNDPGLALHIFLAAFNSRMDRAAISECDRLRHDFEGSWPAAACSVFSVGWAKAQYDLAPLLRDDALSKDPPPSRADTRPRIVALVAAAEALRGRSAVAADLLKTLPATTDPDLLACRALALAALGRRDSAAAITTLVNARPNGKRLLRMYTRALEDVLPVGRAVATSR